MLSFSPGFSVDIFVFSNSSFHFSCRLRHVSKNVNRAALVGDHVYHSTFDLTGTRIRTSKRSIYSSDVRFCVVSVAGFNLEQLQVFVRFIADNTFRSVEVNGVSQSGLGQGARFFAFSTFGALNGLIAGPNQITIKITNSDTATVFSFESRGASFIISP